MLKLILLHPVELKSKVAEISVELNMNHDADSSRIDQLSRDKLELTGLCEKLKQVSSSAVLNVKIIDKLTK